MLSKMAGEMAACKCSIPENAGKEGVQAAGGGGTPEVVAFAGGGGYAQVFILYPPAVIFFKILCHLGVIFMREKNRPRAHNTTYNIYI